MFTKDEMLEEDCCSGVPYCSECPFDHLKGMFFSECYAKNIERYKKEKELKLEKKEFTLTDITDAMHSGKPIVVGSIPMFFNKGKWDWYPTNSKEKIGPASPNFERPHMWSYYKEPKKTVKKTFYKAFFLDEGIISGSRYHANKSDIEDSIGSDDIIEWEEREFEIEED